MENPRLKAVVGLAERKALKTIENKGPFSEKYGVNTFNDEMMRKYLPKQAYDKLRATIDTGESLDPDLADSVAHGIKEWALSKGATHFSHWFQPMTELTAEKHDAFIRHIDKDKVIERFSGRELAQGEPDASSFPSGGLRATFEARGYTIWDPGTPSFIIESPNGTTLCIPSVFISYSGESLDKKAPLLRSGKIIEKAAIRVLGLFGNKSKRVKTTLGAEQEYFLIDRSLYNLRPDLVLTGRTLFGARPPKGQQLEDHYFGSIKERVLSYMMEVEDELIRLGIPVKTRHNEVAPNQFEIAPIFEDSSIASDHNQIAMEVMRKVATKHGLVLLLHEKPFAGINGSGKHNNWSMVDEFGNNLLEPSQTPHENLQFLVCLLAVVRALKRYGHILRASVASAGNDHRLGANEAPPAIMSVFLGTGIMDVLDTIENDTSVSKSKSSVIDLGLENLPKIAKDTTDRNRTSPFAFTGNKFEFRAVGSSASCSTPNLVINVMVAESLDTLANRIEAKMREGSDLKKAVLSILRETITEVRPVIFNGDNYSSDWHKEADKRGLYNDRNTPAALKHIVGKDSIDLFTKYKVFTEAELHSRYHIHTEAYVKTVDIEAQLVREMALNTIIPTAITYAGSFADGLAKLAALKGVNAKALEEQTDLVNKLIVGIAGIKKEVEKLETELDAVRALENEQTKAESLCNKVIPIMSKVREHADILELMVDDSLWPLPKYREMLFLL
ncbi:MAG: glutamine synthetase [Candidatus Raymondbacteria bacterium RifOxyA12_full_50_37]|uniref:Glutamine synthetase n=1 Tax=Candidatus Raymondbacteria bacterium RIFOXYD12_FULL_49_13 TaxID=1817890 RepID=A0A1F7F4N9_UNCRA|nr:MAG: glutamine synthetase [Candidatus Raymondbacteria bacterium RifOxyA12_full_50_37]OGJ91305.1 MAG: glutamine synthetase [Candidatus Raymondbacteria bacterium RifOxyB12_full_50_8]OGJ92213.1 MAG: glutamine synthetase [Candidatus Raymondbacteria bacterium RIFOXYA2_FULL_49_16]OGJ98539.1 MAG: glutamine synthetase [Candidatus Raymondbacteria bacterium RIFOXYC2_FULL_50_21]OGK01601.1 MAG: glutamine synthetase [Candidatus Raymondbacteria bacterium RIFOXYD12_FULL_49_13]OGP44208.1 MAG: glutamine syn